MSADKHANTDRHRRELIEQIKLEVLWVSASTAIALIIAYVLAILV